MTAERAEEVLREYLHRFKAAVNELVKVRLCQHQFDALVALVFNIGPQAFSDSTLLRLLNFGMYDDAALPALDQIRREGNGWPGLSLHGR
ncbi:lysozyme [Stutzerimonas stutzeri]|uniref:lysozyme n=1 Tax=Stutzerimonas stutzeri TaxID=316 RepID=UPI00220CEE8A|nr:lysozyme [Stutzerimonas stutzeri]UVO19117.1 lysozyme [Stutzerimonas stutzeri]